MPPEATPDQRIAAWRQDGADRVDPVRFHTLAALATRTARLQGVAREVVEARLAAFTDEYARLLADRMPGADASPAQATAPGALAARPLLALVAALQGADSGDVPGFNAPAPSRIGQTKPGSPDHRVSHAPSVSTGAHDSLPALDEFRQLWTRLRTEEQLRQSRQEAPEDAGPLNSGVLVHRAIALMRDAAPGYLGHFLSYLDALAWLDQMQGGGALPAPDAAAAPITGRPPRRRPRKRAG